MFFLPHCLTKAGGMSNLGYSAQTPCKGGTHRTNLGTSHMHLLDKHRKQSTLQTPPLFCRQHVPSPKTYRLIWQFELKDSILGTTEFHKAVFTLMVCEGKRKARWIDKKRFGYLWISYPIPFISCQKTLYESNIQKQPKVLNTWWYKKVPRV